MSNDLIWFSIVLLMIGINVGNAILWYQRERGELKRHIVYLNEILKKSEDSRHYFEQLWIKERLK